MAEESLATGEVLELSAIRQRGLLVHVVQIDPLNYGLLIGLIRFRAHDRFRGGKFCMLKVEVQPWTPRHRYPKRRGNKDPHLPLSLLLSLLMGKPRRAWDPIC